MSTPQFRLRRTIPGLLLVLCSIRVMSQTDVRALASRVDQHYDRMHTLEAQFTETYTGAGMPARKAAHYC